MPPGIKRADVVVADTGDDEDNLVVCLIAKKHSRARCIARVNNPKNKLIFESIDRDAPITLISSTEVILDAINEHVNVADLSLIAKLKDGDLETRKGSPFRRSRSPTAKRLADIGLPRSSIVVAVDRKHEEVVIPGGDTILRAGDNLILMVKSASRADVRAALIGAKLPVS